MQSRAEAGAQSDGGGHPPALALVVAITGIVATMPYIALQLVGLEAVVRTMGLNGTGIVGHLPLIVAFVTPFSAFWMQTAVFRPPIAAVCIQNAVRDATS